MKTTWIPVPANWQKLKHHPHSAVVGFGEGIDLDGLAAHMRLHGYDQDEPIILYRSSPKEDWRILSGRHRHAAAIAAEVVPTFKALEGGEDKAREHARKDILRRHLSESQRAMMGAALTTKQRGDNQHTDASASSQGEIAKTLRISTDILQQARKVQEQGTKQLQDAVRDGTVSVKDAAGVVKEAPEVQDKAVDAVKNGRARTAKQAAASIPKEREPGDDTEEEAEHKRRHQANGKPLFDKVKYKAAWQKLYLQPDELCRPYPGAKDGPKAEGLRRLLVEFNKNFEELEKELKKGKPE